jgi:hypothetical protein
MCGWSGCKKWCQQPPDRCARAHAHKHVHTHTHTHTHTHKHTHTHTHTSQRLHFQYNALRQKLAYDTLARHHRYPHCSQPTNPPLLRSQPHRLNSTLHSLPALLRSRQSERGRWLLSRTLDLRARPKSGRCFVVGCCVALGHPGRQGRPLVAQCRGRWREAARISSRNKT